MGGPKQLVKSFEIRGWIGYYGAFSRSRLYFLAQRTDEHLVRWASHAESRAGRPPFYGRRAG